MTIVRRACGLILTLLGGALIAIATLLAVMLPIAYVEWDDGVSSGLTTFGVAAVIAAPGLVLSALGGWMADRYGLSLVKRSTAILLLGSGLGFLLAPTGNVIWGLIKGTAFSAPGGPWSPYVIAPLSGIALAVLGYRLYATTAAIQPYRSGDAAAQDRA